MSKLSKKDGIKFFRCKDCLLEWQVICSNYSDRVGMFCPMKNYSEHKNEDGFVRPYDWKVNKNFKLDKFGNLV